MNQIKLIQLVKEVIAEAEEAKLFSIKKLTDTVFQAIKNGQLVMIGLDELSPELIKNRLQADKKVSDAVRAGKKITIDGEEVKPEQVTSTFTPLPTGMPPGATAMGYGGTGFGRGGQFYAGD